MENSIDTAKVLVETSLICLESFEFVGSLILFDKRFNKILTIGKKGFKVSGSIKSFRIYFNHCHVLFHEIHITINNLSP